MEYYGTTLGLMVIEETVIAGNSNAIVHLVMTLSLSSNNWRKYHTTLFNSSPSIPYRLIKIDTLEK